MRHAFERWSVGAPQGGARATSADVTASTAATDAATDTVSDATKDASGPLQALIELGLARGFVTRGDIGDAYPRHPRDDAHIAATALTLRELGIAVREATEKRHQPV